MLDRSIRRPAQRDQLGHQLLPGGVPCRRRRRALFLQLAGSHPGADPVVGHRQPRHRHGLPPPADPSVLQGAEMGGIPVHDLRHHDARRRPDLLGRDPSHPSSPYRQAGRSAFAARRQVVVAHGLDHERQGDASLHRRARALRPRPGEGPLPRLDQQMALGAADGVGHPDSGGVRLAGDPLGGLPARDPRAALHLAREFRDASVGLAALRHRETIRATASGSRSSPSAKAGTTTTMPTCIRPAMDCAGGRST